MIKKKIILNAKKIDSFLKNYFKKQKKTLLVEPMKYSTLAGGKKIRSSIIINTGKLFNINIDKLVNVCAAVECIHSYSLIHDDLPCMDNDKIRRGKPSTHIKFGESSAVLAGNSLLTLAFEMIADKNYYIDNIFDTIWQDGLNMNDEIVIQKILKNLNINPKTFTLRIASSLIKDSLREKTNEAYEKDIFGAPTFVSNNKIFWGQDRIEFALKEASK